MNIALLVLHVLTCLVAVSVCPVYGQSTCCDVDNCCDDSCNAPPPFNITLTELVSNQPLYVVFYPLIPIYAGLDSTCCTFIPLPDGTYLRSLNRVYSSNPSFNITQEYVMTQKQPGIFPSGSANCNEDYIIFDYLQTKDCSVYLAYLCSYYGDCPYESGNNIPVLGLSRNKTQISSACLAEAIDLMRRDGIANQTYFTLPMKLPTGCVTKIC